MRSSGNCHQLNSLFKKWRGNTGGEKQQWNLIAAGKKQARKTPSGEKDRWEKRHIGRKTLGEKSSGGKAGGRKT